MKLIRRLDRVDLQVSIMTGLMVIFSCMLLFVLHYGLTSYDMILSLQDRVSSIYSYLDNELDAETFLNINTREDAALPSYTRMQQLLQNIKQATGVRYLYTAKPLEDGSFIYVVDGLPPDAEDFRYPGDLIEPEIVEDMRTALGSTPVLPDHIVNTSWGPIFISYLPIHGDDGNVIGVLGIEFDAAHQYRTYQFLRIGTPIIIILVCAIACILAVILFRRISNPNYRDLSNTDLLTDLKNRNSFETDLHNLDSKKCEGICMFSVDLDDLKTVNDTLGHLAGDRYIKSGTEVLQKTLMPGGVLYRVGGDEFAIIARDWNISELPNWIACLNEAIAEVNHGAPISLSLSIGCAMFDAEQDSDLMSVFRRADEQMYAQKRRKKKIHLVAQ